MQLDVVTFLTMVMLWTPFLPTNTQMTQEEHTVEFKEYNADVPLLSNVLTERFLDDVEDGRVESSQIISHKQSIILHEQLRGLLSGQLLDNPHLLFASLYDAAVKGPDVYFNFQDIGSQKLPSKRLTSLSGLKIPLGLEKRSSSFSRSRSRLRSSSRISKKREFPLEIAQSVCPAITDWKLLRSARDINDTEVEVLQPPDPRADGPQYFYTTTCFNRAYQSRRGCRNCCIGINHRSFSSACLQKKSYVLAQIGYPSQRVGWGFIQVNSSCNCAIAPRMYGN